MITGRCQRKEHSLCKKQKCKCSCHPLNRKEKRLKKYNLIPVWVFVLLTSLALVSAFDDGSVLTQTQIDSINAETYDLQCVMTNTYNGLTSIDGRRYWAYSYSCQHFTKGATRYNVGRVEYDAKVQDKEYRRCLNNRQRSFCQTYFINDLRKQVKEVIRAERQNIKNFQSNDDTVFGNDLANVNILG